MTTLFQDEEAFVRAIVDAPDDDAPRLIYSDWLDVHGQSERAEFIRVQIALAGYGVLRVCPNKKTPLVLFGIPVSPSASQCQCRYCELRKREEYLLGFGGVRWLRAVDERLVFHGLSTLRRSFHRGMVERIAFSADDFLRRIDQVISKTTVREVRVTTPLDWYTGADLFVRLTAGFSVPGATEYVTGVRHESLWGEESPILLRILEKQWPSVKNWVLTEPVYASSSSRSSSLSASVGRPVAESGSTVI